MLTFILAVGKLFGQSQEQSTPWALGGSLQDQPKAIQTKLDSDHRILKVSKKEIFRTASGDSAYIFLGKVNDPLWLDSYKLDSSNILLTAGRSHGNNGIKYTGYCKILQTEFFSSDAAAINKLYDLAVKEFRKGSKRKQCRKALIRMKEKQGKMITITYSDSEKQFNRMEISNSYNPSTGAYSLFLNKWLSDNKEQNN